MKRSVILFAVLGLGCATLSPEAQAVRITTNPDVVRPCRYIAQVRGADGLSTNYGALARDNATADLKNEASKVGANTVFLNSSSDKIGAVQLGEAYSCPATPRPSPTP